MNKMKIVLAFVLLNINVFAQLGFQNFVKIKPSSDTIKVNAGDSFEVILKVEIDEGWHINSDKPNEDFLVPTTIELNNSQDFEIVEIKFPKPKSINFSFSSKPVSVFEGKFDLVVKLRAKENSKGFSQPLVRLNYQACNNASCMPPNVASTSLHVTINNDNNLDSVSNSNEQNVEKKGTENSIAETFKSSGLIFSLLFVFLGGLALNLTPCVYPLIPITIGYFGGQSEGKTSRLFLLGILYVLGMAITYSVIGVVTALSGAVFGALLQNPIVIIIISLIFILLSLSMFGVYEFKLPDSWVIKAGGAKSGMFGALIMGLTMGVVAAPCIGPFVLGLLTFVAAEGDILLGFMMFFFLALGLGTPYLILAVFSGKIKSLPRAGFWMDGVKHIFGFVLIGMAIYFISPLLPKQISEFVLPVYAIGVGIFLIFFDKLANDVKIFKWVKIFISVLLIIVSVYMLIPEEKKSPDWQVYSDELFQSSLGKEKILIDFYADWCIPCKELDALTFSDPKVIELSKNFTTLKVDMTKTMDDETERIRKKFNILGMPTLLIFDSEGKEVERITGFIDAKSFENILTNIK